MHSGNRHGTTTDVFPKATLGSTVNQQQGKCIGLLDCVVCSVAIAFLYNSIQFSCPFSPQSGISSICRSQSAWLLSTNIYQHERCKYTNLQVCEVNRPDSPPVYSKICWTCWCPLQVIPGTCKDCESRLVCVNLHLNGIVQTYRRISSSPCLCSLAKNQSDNRNDGSRTIRVIPYFQSWSWWFHYTSTLSFVTLISLHPCWGCAHQSVLLIAVQQLGTPHGSHYLYLPA